MTDQAMQRLADGETRLLCRHAALLRGMERRVDAASLSLSRYPREYRELPERMRARRASSSTAAALGRWREREPDLGERDCARRSWPARA